MKNTSVSLFRQVLDLIPKREFEEIVMKHNGDKRKQSFDSWAHFVSMIFCLEDVAGSHFNGVIVVVEFESYTVHGLFSYRSGGLSAEFIGRVYRRESWKY